MDRKMSDESEAFTMPIGAAFGEFDSWKIENRNKAIKHTDKSFYDYNSSGIPKSVVWFFEANGLELGTRLNIILRYDAKEYLAYVKREPNMGRTRLFWNTNLGNIFRAQIKEFGCYPFCVFERIGKRKYQVFFKRDSKDGYAEALDESFSDDERIHHAREIDYDSLVHIATNRRSEKPKIKTVSTSQYTRDPYISELAKRRAMGICQLCKQPAPFLRPDGVPYLETHHIIWLANGGEDSIENTVALCPNCHTKMHILNDENDVRVLKTAAKIGLL